jgi:hypothetical protein
MVASERSMRECGANVTASNNNTNDASAPSDASSAPGLGAV